MPQINTRLPRRLVNRIDTLGRRLHRSRTELVHQALEYYLEELESLRAALEPVVAPAGRRQGRGQG